MTTVCDHPDQTRGAPKKAIQASLDALSTPVLGLVLIGAMIISCYINALAHLIGRWSNESNYSHGFLVPILSAWLLWHRRNLMQSIVPPLRGRWLGVILLLLSVVIRYLAAYFGFILADAVALIVCVGGTAIVVGGLAAVRWSWPAIVFLAFMIPLPGDLAGRLSEPLQHIATLGSTYVLQTLGVPAIASGNVICLNNGRIGVAEACNGLGMLTTFAAVTTAAVLLIRLSHWEKACVLASSVGIAIAANIFRISATGVAQELIGAEFADRVFHSVAGWAMVPFALLMLGLELLLIAKLFQQIPAGPLVMARYAGRAIKANRA